MGSEEDDRCEEQLQPNSSPLVKPGVLTKQVHLETETKMGCGSCVDAAVDIGHLQNVPVERVAFGRHGPGPPRPERPPTLTVTASCDNGSSEQRLTRETDPPST